MTNDKHQKLIKEQMEYYSGRASEYDQWFLRQERYDKGELVNARWLKEVASVRTELAALGPVTEVLELACGTGLWTEELLKISSSLTAVDGSAEMITINKSKPGRDKVNFVQANLFEWQAQKKYDLIFFSFWLSHVPPEKFNDFWQMVKESLTPNGQVFFIDSLYTQESTAFNQKLRGKKDTIVSRVLNDGTEFEIVKVFYDPDQLQKDLKNLGWNVNVLKSGKYFLYGGGGVI
ncbi:MAG: class I SAM-dependent methyltransferase [Chloroflexi bacterium]|jgi:2-polyprenyl-3-methyl-5-hydroxy-6-metoxy-1,4-benzoquinol methylase|nr:class I SAM-dependent methyltransferase [Chloroflexota bacterium]MBT3671017.1 class I SAM-dependent methyltransferase [Chloroflexota bacterium]MBT4003588.1 class I SAM-dependent methyltransferase [Chloroflexota bacterium]MBT4305050.1 class I SAM-dependent methyltransferase [Chloroflexota bacterium]MBT4533861.1 class I SAM-dependent methyltransferase [Chloroflexota bacterium]